MPRKSPKSAMALLFALFVLVVLQLSCIGRHPSTIRLAGDEWFLDSLTKTGLIADFEQKNGIRVEVVHKNDRTIMSDLDRGPNRGDTLNGIVGENRSAAGLAK